MPCSAIFPGLSMEGDVGFLAALAAPYRTRLLIGSGLMGIVGALALLVPWTVGTLAGTLLVTETKMGMVPLFGLLLASFVGQSICSLLHQRFTAGLYSDLVFTLRLRLYDRVQRLSYE